MQPHVIKGPGLAGLGDKTVIDLAISEVYVGRWMSQTGLPVNTDADMLVELQRLGQATTTLPTEQSVYDFAGGVPYTTVLKNLREWQARLSQSNNVYLKSLLYYIIDTTKNGSIYQDPAVLAEIMTPTDPYNVYDRANNLNTELPVTWQPNYFNPAFKINGTNVLANMGLTAYDLSGSTGNPGISSFGASLPLMIDDIYYKPKSGIQSIVASGCVLQNVLTKYQRYALVCEATFLL